MDDSCGLAESDQPDLEYGLGDTAHAAAAAVAVADHLVPQRSRVSLADGDYDDGGGSDDVDCLRGVEHHRSTVSRARLFAAAADDDDWSNGSWKLPLRPCDVS